MPFYLQVIQTISLAIIAVGIGLVGKFLYTTFRQQLANKQSEIDTLKTHIKHLESLTAPVLADQLKKLVPVVEEYAKKVGEQEAQLRTISPAGMTAAQNSYRLGIARAILEALGAFITILGKTDGTSLHQQIAQLTVSLLSTMAEALRGKTPDLSHVEAILKVIAEQYPDIANQLRALPVPADN